MCGINGFDFGDKALVRKMNASIEHRGPDDKGDFVGDKASLGFCRLAIIDLSPEASQPMWNNKKDVVIIFNGEIYNFRELRKELEKEYTFRTRGDTEVILASYDKWGEDCVNHFNGMWAFCIYDLKKERLFLSRDRFGKKPLYYYNKNGKFIFSSEIKAILQHGIKREINPRAISSFLEYRYVLGSESFFKDINKLLPAENLIYDLKKKEIVKKHLYWDLPSIESNPSEKEAIAQVEKLLQDSVRYRAISDVPLGVMLSGGLDSSLITAVLSKQQKSPVKTFTVTFKEKGYDESENAREVAKLYKTEHHEVPLDTDNFLSLMEEYSGLKDEPIGVPNEIAMYALSKKIKKHVTVILSGEGADELFEGYGRKFSSVRDYHIIQETLAKKGGDKVLLENFKRLHEKYGSEGFKNELEHFLGEYYYWSPADVKRVLHPQFDKTWDEFFAAYLKDKKWNYSKKMSYIFLKVHLPGLLERLDNATMHASIESRAPFLDYKFAEYVFSLPSELKTRWLIDDKKKRSMDANTDDLSEKANVPKYILKQVARKYLPGGIVDRIKQGFPLPLQRWFTNEFSDIARRELLSKSSRIREFVDQKELEHWMANDPDGKRFGQKIWMLLSLEMWLRKWMS